MTSPGAPAVSVLVPVYDPEPAYLEQAIGSVRAQTRADWELILVDDASPSAAVRQVLDQAAAGDPRVRVEHLAANAGIARASQRALGLARGEWIALLDHDDWLEPDALDAVVAAGGDGADYVYTDEDRVTPDGAVPLRKPDWSPERLRSQMYTGHLSVLRRALVERVGGFRTGFDGSQDYDLVLRVTERARRVAHVRRVLYHWRLVPTSVGQVGRPEVFGAARRALADHLRRTGIPGWVEQVDPTGVYRVHRPVAGTPLVSVIIPTRGSSGRVWGRERVFVVDAARSIAERSTWPHLEVVVVADSSTPAPVVEELEAILGDRLVLRWYREPFNYARKVNLGAAHARGGYFLLLNDDVEVISPDWVETLLGLAQDPGVGMVGALLYFEDGTIQHAGHVYQDLKPDHIGYEDGPDERGPLFGYGVTREVSGVTTACALLPRAAFVEVGGLSPYFAVNYNDVDLALKVRTAGRRILWTPDARLHHFESKSRSDPRVGHHEVVLIQQRWGRELHEDPYWR